MKMSEKEERILGALQLDADLSIQSLRKLTGFRDSTIHYCLSSLLRRNAIRRYVAIDTQRLGYMEVAITCSLFFSSLPEEKWRERVMGISELLSLWSIGGGSSYYLVVLVRSPEELEALYDVIFRGVDIRSKEVAFRCHFRFYGRRYLKQRGEVEFIERGRAATTVTIDKVDESIISLLGKGGEVTKTAIARKLGVPLTTLSYRIGRLEREKVIAGEVYSDASDFGSLIYMLFISTSSPGQAFEEELHQLCLRETRFTAMGSWAGQWDYLLMADVTNLKMLGELLETLRLSLGGKIITIREAPVFTKHKNDSFLS